MHFLTDSGTYVAFMTMYAIAAIFIFFSTITVSTTQPGVVSRTYGLNEFVILGLLLVCLGAPALLVKAFPFWRTPFLTTIAVFVLAFLLSFASNHINSKHSVLYVLPKQGYLLLAIFASASSWIALLQYWCEDVLMRSSYVLYGLS